MRSVFLELPDLSADSRELSTGSPAVLESSNNSIGGKRKSQDELPVNEPAKIPRQEELASDNTTAVDATQLSYSNGFYC